MTEGWNGNINDWLDEQFPPVELFCISGWGGFLLNGSNIRSGKLKWDKDIQSAIKRGLYVLNDDHEAAMVCNRLMEIRQEQCIYERLVLRPRGKREDGRA